MQANWSALTDIAIWQDNDKNQPVTRNAESTYAVISAKQALSHGDINIVGEILKGQGTFYEMNHYPSDDVYDRSSHSQYYYHAHRNNDEHGHFHTFIRRAGIASHIQPAQGFQRTEAWPQGDDEIAHLIGISMDASGNAQGLFATNRWVTGESWYSAADTIELLDQFAVDHAYPNLAVNQWLTHFLRAYRHEIELLLRHRDLVIDRWQQLYPDRDVLDDRELEITGYLTVDESYLAG